MIAVVSSLQLGMGAVETLVAPSVMFWFWSGSAVLVLLATLRIERYLAKQRRKGP